MNEKPHKIKDGVRPSGMAISYFLGWRSRFKVLRLEYVYVPYRNGTIEWCNVYAGKRKVWDCNPIFANNNFKLIDPSSSQP